MKEGRRETIDDFPVCIGPSVRDDNLKLRMASQQGAGAEARRQEGNEERKEGPHKGEEGEKEIRENRAEKGTATR